MRGTRPLTVAAGLALGLLALVQSQRLVGLGDAGRDGCLQAEMAGTACALHWRLERDIALGNHNSASLQAGLEDVLIETRRLSWASLFSESGERLASAGQVPELQSSALQETRQSPPDELPRVVPGPEGAVIGLTRLRLAQREFILAAGRSPDESEDTAAANALGRGTLLAGLAAALLLVIHGLSGVVPGKSSGQKH